MNNDQNKQNTPPASPPESGQTAADTNPAAQKVPQSLEGDFDPVIFSYSRKQAIADGCQIDVSQMAAEAGFCIPVFMTDSVYLEFVGVPDGVECQDVEGRLWDVLWMLRCAIAKASSQDDRLPFQLYVRNNNVNAELVTLHAVCGALDIDDPAPSITIMLPHED